jgi:hypothetical protein
VSTSEAEANSGFPFLLAALLSGFLFLPPGFAIKNVKLHYSGWNMGNDIKGHVCMLQHLMQTLIT